MRPEGRTVWYVDDLFFDEDAFYRIDSKNRRGAEKGKFHTDSELADLISDVRREALEEFRDALNGTSGDGFYLGRQIFKRLNRRDIAAKEVG